MVQPLDYSINFDDYLYYDETSSTCLRWKVDIMKGRARSLVLVSKGSVAGTFRHTKAGKRSQITVGLGRKGYRAHRIIYTMFYGEITGNNVIDHLDGNPFNNKIGNLSMKTPRGNSQNSGVADNSPFGISGVTCESSNFQFPCFRARVRLLEKDLNKAFSVHKYGLMPAFKMAVLWRDEQIRRLNEEGSQFTDRHGKEVSL